MASIPATDYFPDNEEELYKNKLSDLSSISINYNQDHHDQDFWIRKNLTVDIWKRIKQFEHRSDGGLLYYADLKRNQVFGCVEFW
ncbi:cyclic nucleotide-binding-like protein [Rhizophagus clarus]|uniref:Cyclic nucleotide-binding-like protein n=1 Tax=Rhizophagus clarus TaxID=94130 RepID=A0A8H3KT66_9GLOM|nr:cyclic nucleotide-binding-like protein [Rhizophagus clarus]